MKYRFLGCAIVFTGFTAFTASMPVGSLQIPPQQDDTHRVTAHGCLKQQKDVSGLTSNGGALGEGFILTKAMLSTVAITGSESDAQSAAAMYRITGQSDEKLRAMLHQQVEVTGRLESAPRVPETLPPPQTTTAERDKHAQTDEEAQQQPILRAENLPQIRTSAIRVIAGSCAGGTW